MAEREQHWYPPRYLVQKEKDVMTDNDHGVRVDVEVMRGRGEWYLHMPNHSAIGHYTNLAEAIVTADAIRKAIADARAEAWEEAVVFAREERDDD